MPVFGIPGGALLLGILLTVVGLAVAKFVRCIELEGVGSLFATVVGLIVVGWGVSYLSTFILADKVNQINSSGLAVIFGIAFGKSFVTNTIALGATSLFVSGLKIRGFFGLMGAGFIITLAEQSLVLFPLAQMTF